MSTRETAAQRSLAGQIWDRLHELAVDLAPRRAEAATPAACDSNLLNPSNYSSAAGCFGQNSTAAIPLVVPGTASTGSVTISHLDGSIDRTVNP